jgi:hypothetical protein
MLTLYLKKVFHNHGFDVLAYREPECVRPVAHWRAGMSNRPDRRFKFVMFNCYRWRVEWIA